MRTRFRFSYFGRNRLKLTKDTRFYASQENANIRLDGKTAIITGSNTGIGKYTALDFFYRGCRVIMACRDLGKAEIAKNDIMNDMKFASRPGKLLTKRLDLSSIQSVHTFCEEILREESNVHFLVNNAGIMMCPKETTVDGFEMQFGTNHLGHFLLTIMLLPIIIKSAPARIINLSSMAYKVGNIDFNDLNWNTITYSPLGAYARSKLANILFTKELARRLQGTGVTVYAIHPGLVKTELGRYMDGVMFPGFRWIYRKCFGWCSKTPRQGAETTIFCAIDKKCGRETGLFYRDCQAFELKGKAADKELASKLWDVSWELVGLKDFDPFVKERLTTKIKNHL